MNSIMYVDQCFPATQVDLYCNTLRQKTLEGNMLYPYVHTNIFCVSETQEVK